MVDAANSKNFGTVTKPEGTAGVYCIAGLPFTPRNAVASVGTNGDAAIAALVVLGTADGTCPEGTQISVGLLNAVGETANAEFMININ